MAGVPRKPSLPQTLSGLDNRVSILERSQLASTVDTDDRQVIYNALGWPIADINSNDLAVCANDAIEDALTDPNPGFVFLPKGEFALCRPLIVPAWKMLVGGGALTRHQSDPHFGGTRLVNMPDEEFEPFPVATCPSGQITANQSVDRFMSDLAGEPVSNEGVPGVNSINLHRYTSDDGTLPPGIEAGMVARVMSGSSATLHPACEVHGVDYDNGTLTLSPFATTGPVTGLEIRWGTMVVLKGNTQTGSASGEGNCAGLRDLEIAARPEVSTYNTDPTGLIQRAAIVTAGDSVIQDCGFYGGLLSALDVYRGRARIFKIRAARWGPQEERVWAPGVGPWGARFMGADTDAAMVSIGSTTGFGDGLNRSGGGAFYGFKGGSSTHGGPSISVRTNGGIGLIVSEWQTNIRPQSLCLIHNAGDTTFGSEGGGHAQFENGIINTHSIGPGATWMDTAETGYPIIVEENFGAGSNSEAASLAMRNTRMAPADQDYEPDTVVRLVNGSNPNTVVENLQTNKLEVSAGYIRSLSRGGRITARNVGTWQQYELTQAGTVNLGSSVTIPADTVTDVLSTPELAPGVYEVSAIVRCNDGGVYRARLNPSVAANNQLFPEASNVMSAGTGDASTAAGETVTLQPTLIAFDDPVTITLQVHAGSGATARPQTAVVNWNQATAITYRRIA